MRDEIIPPVTATGILPDMAVPMRAIPILLPTTPPNSDPNNPTKEIIMMSPLHRKW